MQPAATAMDGTSGVKLVKGEAIGGEVPVNDEKWWKRKEQDVPVDEVSSRLLRNFCLRLLTLCTAVLPQILHA